MNEEMRKPIKRMEDGERIGKPIKRVDAGEKIGEEAKYIADIEFEDMLYARTLRSTVARGKIVSIEIPELPSGYYIVDKSDVPGRNRVKIIFYDMPFLRRMKLII